MYGSEMMKHYAVKWEVTRGHNPKDVVVFSRGRAQWQIRVIRVKW